VSAQPEGVLSLGRATLCGCPYRLT
jgi:hypothetical protein